MTNDAIFDFSKFKSVLCLNGKLPSYETLRDLNLPIIAADGAVNKLFDMGLPADIVVGDLDSVSVSWIIYGIYTKSSFVIWSNIIGLLTSLISIFQKETL